MSQTLWAPWRMEYILGEKTDACVFCEALAEGPQKYGPNRILHAWPDAFVIVNRFPYSYANIMVIPNRHVCRLDELLVAERQSLFELMVESQLRLERALRPQGMNVGINLGSAAGAGIKDHLHIHLAPRWNGDVNFMPLLGDTKIMPQHLDETYDMLLPFFADIE